MKTQHPRPMFSLCVGTVLICLLFSGMVSFAQQEAKPQEQTLRDEQEAIKNKAIEDAKKTIQAESPVPPAVDKPLPGRNAPLWDKGGGREAQYMPQITKMRDGLFRVGKIIINKAEGLVTVQGEVNMQEGLIEYLATAGGGKLHESLLKLDAEPYDLQIALLLMGVEPGTKPLKSQGDPGKPDGDPVEIWITWSDKDKKMVKHRAEDLIFNKAENKPMGHTNWVFCGSQIINGRFMAAVERSIAAVYHDPFAILDNPSESGGSDLVHIVNSQVTPPKGTPINFVIKSVKQAQTRGPHPPMVPPSKAVDPAKSNQ